MSPSPQVARSDRSGFRVRQDDPSSTSSPWMTPRLRPLAHVPAWASSGALAVLMVLTSWAVASVAVWLVVPYFALMVAILFAPAGRFWGKVGRSEGSEARPVS